MSWSLSQNKPIQEDTRPLCYWHYATLCLNFSSIVSFFNLNLCIDVSCIPGALKSPVYRYLVTYTPSKQANASSWLPFPSRFAFHLLDSLAFFRGLEMVLGTLSQADINFQEMITEYFVHFAKEGNVRFPILLIKHLTSILNAWPYFLRFNVKYIRHRSKVWGQWDFYVVAEIKQIFYSTSMHYILSKSIILQNNI